MSENKMFGCWLGLMLLGAAPACDETGLRSNESEDPSGATGKADDGDSTAEVVIQDNITVELSWSQEGSLSDVPELPLSQDGVLAECGASDAGHTAQVMCWFHENADRGSFAGAPGNQGEPSIEIEYAVFRAPQERAAVVVCTGRTESYLKYAEFAYDFMVVNADLGYSLYLIDHRGQGYSERMLKRDPSQDLQRGYVHHFDDYVTDLNTFVETVVRPDGHQRVFGLAHSMGGGIMTRYLQAHHERAPAFDAVILTSPMHGIAAVDGEETGGPLGWAKELGSLTFLRGWVATGQGWRYTPGGGPFDPDWGFFTGTEGNSVTHSLPRHTFINWLYRSEPEIQLGSGTARWVVEASDATDAIKSDVSRREVDIPVLLLQAGQEQIVSNPDQAKVCDQMPTCRLEIVPGARHEPIFEVDEIRDDYLNRVVSFYEENIRP